MLLRYAALLVTLHTSIVCAHINKPWNELIFTQTWPASFCVQIQIQKTHVCSIPENVTTWNVHGIWPTENGTMGPNFCNKTDKFNPAKLQPIRDQLLKYWANLFKGEKPEDFWKHEWTKHGTCAEELGPMNSEIKYFSTGLKLNRKIDFLKILTQGGIVPKVDAAYKLDDIKKAFYDGLGVNPKLQCFVDVDKSHQYLVQVEVCLNKQFELIECMKKPHKYDADSSLQRLRRASKHAQNEPCNYLLPISYPPL